MDNVIRLVNSVLEYEIQKPSLLGMFPNNNIQQDWKTLIPVSKFLMSKFVTLHFKLSTLYFDFLEYKVLT